MDAILKRLLRHPIAKKPYHAIHFSHFDQNGIPLYKLRKVEGTFGAKESLRRAFRIYGAHCFHCDKFHAPSDLGDMTRDHAVPLVANGSDLLHNLLFACKACNATKGRNGIVSFRPESAEAYLNALNRHVSESLRRPALRKAAAA